MAKPRETVRKTFARRCIYRPPFIMNKSILILDLEKALLLEHSCARFPTFFRLFSIDRCTCTVHGRQDVGRKERGTDRSEWGETRPSFSSAACYWSKHVYRITLLRNTGQIGRCEVSQATRTEKQSRVARIYVIGRICTRFDASSRWI